MKLKKGKFNKKKKFSFSYERKGKIYITTRIRPRLVSISSLDALLTRPYKTHWPRAN